MQSKRSITEERFLQGLTLDEFREWMAENKERLSENYADFNLSEEEHARLAQLAEPLNVLVLAEDWCGDVLRYLPAFMRMAEAAPDWRVRVFYRDRNPDLAEMWLKAGVQRAIPVFAFFDDRWGEIGYFQEKPPQVYLEEADARQEFASQYPEQPDAALPYAEMSEQTQALYAPYFREFRRSRMPHWQRMFVDDLISMLEKRQAAMHIV